MFLVIVGFAGKRDWNMLHAVRVWVCVVEDMVIEAVHCVDVVNPQSNFEGPALSCSKNMEIRAFQILRCVQH